MPVAVTSMVLPPTMFPVLLVEGERQLTSGMMNQSEPGTVTVTAKVALIEGEKLPPPTLAIVTASPVIKPCGAAVITRQGLLHIRGVVKLVGGDVQFTAVPPADFTVNVFVPVFVTVHVLPFRDVPPPLNAPPLTPLIVTAIVSPTGRLCAATVVTTQGLATETD